MKWMAKIIYRFLIIPLALFLIHFVGLFNQKIKKSISGRYKAVQILTKLKSNGKPVLMIHASSLGEFEHIRPLIYRLGNNFRIIVTFFSPSGYEHAKTSMPDEVHVYLPFDIYCLWKKILKQVTPKMLIISKHDVWANQVLAAKNLNIPVFLVNASLSEKSSRLNPFYRFLLKEAYNAIDMIFTISEEDAQRFKKYFKVQKIKVIGDTKFDQVLIRKEMALKKELIKQDWAGENVLVLGSIWPEDYQAIKAGLLELMQKYQRLKVIAVPHQPSVQFVQKLLDDFSNFGAQKFSSIYSLTAERALVVDVVGVLADLYKYANLAYVGGSFKQGIHNVMEAAVYGIPVMFGPVHKNSFEAVDLVNQGAALIIKNKDDFLKVMQKLIENEEFARQLGQKTASYVQRKTGATDKILEEWQNVL